MIFNRISPIVSILAFTLRILSGTILAKRKQGVTRRTREKDRKQNLIKKINKQIKKKQSSKHL